MRCPGSSLRILMNARSGIVFALMLVGLFGLAACSDPPEDKPASDDLSKILETGKLVVLTVNSPSSYYYDRDEQLAGPEYDMTQSFAQHLGVQAVYRDFDTTEQVIAALRSGAGHIAAAGLTVNEQRARDFDFGPSYQTLQEKLVCRRDGPTVRNIEDMAALEIEVAAASSYVDTLESLPGIKFTESSERNTQAILLAVAENRLQCTLVDSTLFAIERRYHTELDNKFTLVDDSQLAWMLNKGNDDLIASINDWFKNYKQDELGQMLDRYYGYVEIFDYVDTHKFLKRVDTRLKNYKKYFIDAARKNGIDPALLAAQSYQESHWNPRAKSPTGVRGIMMLTLPVAKSLGVKSRLDAKENIYAGARFLAKMQKMVEHVEEPDRTWLALAAYNVGRGHFRDAQSLARKLGKDPDKWSDMKDVLPLLSEKKYYKDLRYGYARGNEPVTYVTRIRNYEKLLHRHFDGISSK